MKGLFKKIFIILLLLVIGFSITSCGEKVDCRHCGGSGEPCTTISQYCELSVSKCVDFNNKCGLCLGLGYQRGR